MPLTLNPTDSEDRVAASRRRTQRLIEEYAADSPVHQALNPGDTLKEGLSITGNLVGTALLPAYEKAASALGLRPENELPQAAPVGLKPLPPKAKPLLDHLYGPKGEHWQESFSGMISSPDGLDRFSKWKDLIQHDPDYAPRYEELKKTLGDQREAFWTTVIDEYKGERKKDAELSQESLAGNTALNVASFAIPGALTYSGARAAGAGRVLAAQTAITGELMAPIDLGKMLLSAPAQLVKRPRLLGLPAVGAATGYAASGGDPRGAAEGLFWGAALAGGSGLRSLYREATGKPGTLLDDLARWAKSTEDAIPGPKLELSQLGWGPGKVRPSIGNFAEAANVSPTFAMSPTLTTGALGALYGGLTEGTQGAIIGGLVGAGAGKLAPRAPGPVLGGVIGGMAAMNENDGDPWMSLIGVGAGAVIGAGVQKLGSPDMLRKVIYAEEGVAGAPRDLRTWAKYMGHLVPEADWRRVEILAKHLYPILDRQDKLLDAARGRMREDVLRAVGGQQTLESEAEMGLIYESLEALGRGGVPLAAPVENAAQASALNVVRGLAAGEKGGIERATLAKAVKLRRTMDKWFDDAVEAGLIDEKSYISGHVPRVFDEKEFWARAGSSIKSPEAVQGLDTGLRKLFTAIDERNILRTETSARDAYVKHPVKFVRHLREEKLGLTKAEAESLLGGPHRWTQLDDVNALAQETHTYPSTVVKILRHGRGARDESGLMWGGKIQGDWIPDGLVDEFALARTGADLPVIKHLPTVLDRYIDRTTRRRYYDPLLREWNGYEGGATAATKPLREALRPTLPSEVLKAEDGEPLRVFHGTPAVFDEFAAPKMGTGAGGDLYGKGVYLTNDSAVAGSYAQSGELGTHRLRRRLSKVEAESLSRVLGGPQEDRDFLVRFWSLEARPGIAVSPSIREALEKAGITNVVDVSFKGSPNVRPLHLRGRVFDVDRDSVEVQDLFSHIGRDPSEALRPGTTEIVRASYDDMLGILGRKSGPDMLNDYLKSKGYTGLEYSGGLSTGAKKHRAFVVFDPADVVSPFDAKLYPEGSLEAALARVEASVQEARLKPLHDILRGNKLDNLSEIARKLVNSRLGVPSKTDVVVEDLLFRFMKANPAKYREATRLVLDMQYSGAIGLNPAKAGRNLFQSLLTATALGPGHLAMGMREVARREKTMVALAEKFGALKDPGREMFDVAKIAETTTMRRMWNHYVESAFELFHAADRRNRLWAFAGGHRRALIEFDDVMAKGADSDLLKMLRPEQRARFASQVQTGELSRDEFAGVYGTAISDLTQWVYGKRGSPLATRNVLGANLGIFTSWPANYISLMYEWASNGQIGKIMNMSLGAAILERIGEEAGIGRMTGFTSDQEGALKVLPVGPIPDRMPVVGAPLFQFPIQAAQLAGQVAKTAVGGEGDFNPYRYHSLTLPAQPLFRLGEAGLTSDPEVTMRRLTGLSTPKDR